MHVVRVQIESLFVSYWYSETNRIILSCWVGHLSIEGFKANYPMHTTVVQTSTREKTFVRYARLTIN